MKKRKENMKKKKIDNLKGRLGRESVNLGSLSEKLLD